MKLTFIFSNGSNFVARGVDAESLVISRNSAGVPVLFYISEKEIPTADFEKRFPVNNETQAYTPISRKDGVFSDIIYAARDSETNQTIYSVGTTIDANKAHLDYIIASHSAGGIEANTVHTVIPVRAPLSPDVLADALDLWC